MTVIWPAAALTSRAPGEAYPFADTSKRYIPGATVIEYDPSAPVRVEDTASSWTSDTNASLTGAPSALVTRPATVVRAGGSPAHTRVKHQTIDKTTIAIAADNTPAKEAYMPRRACDALIRMKGNRLSSGLGRTRVVGGLKARTASGGLRRRAFAGAPGKHRAHRRLGRDGDEASLRIVARAAGLT